MTRLIWWIWLRLAGWVPGSDRMVLAAGITIRVAGVIVLCYSLPLSWPHLPHPGWTALLSALLVAESAAVVRIWLWQRRVGPVMLALDLPTGVLALYAGTALAAGANGGWANAVFPYTVFVAAGLGLCTRRPWPAVVSGAVWAAAFTASRWVIDHQQIGDALSLATGYVVNPAVGWLSAHTLRRRAAALEEARLADARQAAELAATVERVRHGRALHDRALQTLETLARGTVIPDEALRARVGEQAAWLRRFIETGLVDQDEDLSAGLAAAARAAGRVGIRVQVNDARLRVARDGVDLAAAQREVLVHAVYQAISSITGTGGAVVLRAVPDEQGVLVTLLASGPAASPHADEVADLATQLTAVGGSVVVDSVPYLELRVRASRTAPASGAAPAETGPA